MGLEDVAGGILKESEPNNKKAERLLQGQRDIVKTMDHLFPEMRPNKCSKQGEVMGVPKKIVCSFDSEDAKGKVSTNIDFDETGTDTALLSAKIDIEEKSEGSGFW